MVRYTNVQDNIYQVFQQFLKIYLLIQNTEYLLLLYQHKGVHLDFNLMNAN